MNLFLRPESLMPYTRNCVLDTLLVSDSEITLKRFHIERTSETFKFLKYSFSSEIEDVYSAVGARFQDNTDRKIVRLLFSPKNPNDYDVEVSDFKDLAVPVKLRIENSVELIEPIHKYKFSDRSRWQNLMKATEDTDVLLVKTGLAVETSRFNLFLHKKTENILLTPTLHSGCLNGVLRRSGIHYGKLQLPGGDAIPIMEKDFSLEEILRPENKLFVGNSVRGLLPAEIVPG
jgi:branched-subunit amino acid aminotransferase/4-amino-4-deoxychorismate lyase